MSYRSHNPTSTSYPGCRFHFLRCLVTAEGIHETTSPKYRSTRRKDARHLRTRTSDILYYWWCRMDTLRDFFVPQEGGVTSKTLHRMFKTCFLPKPVYQFIQILKQYRAAPSNTHQKMRVPQGFLGSLRALHFLLGILSDRETLCCRVLHRKATNQIIL